MPLRLLNSVAVLLLLFALTACSDSYSSVADASVDTMAEMVEVLEGVHDRSTAEAAKPQVDALAARLVDLRERLAGLEDVDAATRAEVDARVEERARPVLERLGPLMIRLRTMPSVAPVLRHAIQSVGATH